MVNYDAIKNERLKFLVMASESINSQPELEIQTMVVRIAALSEEGQKEIIVSLENEQKQICKAKLAIGITPEMEMRELEEEMRKVTTVKKNLEHAIHSEQAENEAVEADSEAMTILKTL